MIKNFTIYRNTKKFTNNSLKINNKQNDILVKCNINKKNYEWVYFTSQPKVFKYDDKKLSIKFTW